MKKALIVVDYQYDFVDPKGSLYVEEADTLKKSIEKLIKEYKASNNFVVCTMDWHPKNHVSFYKWPEHCVQHQKGSELYLSQEVINDIDLIIKKGINKNEDSYSGFYIDKNTKSSLEEYLTANNISDIEIMGVALEICVQATYDDARKIKFLNVNVNEELCKAINKQYKFKY